MKNKSILILAGFFALFTSTVVGQKIILKGSDTVLPLSQKEAEQYMKSNKGASITVIGGGSGVGITALIDGTTNIAMSSRPIKMDERLKLQEAGKAYKEIKIAYDALAIVVNPANKVGQLTREQIESIYTGKITNWKDLGGDDLKIVVYARETSSGTYEFFKEHVLNRKNYSASVLNMPATGAIIQSVSQTKGAIGYVGLAYVEKEVKAISVSYDKGKTFVKPSVQTAMNHTYPIVRPLFYYILSKQEAMVKPFLDFILSATGQSIVAEIGYIKL